MLNGAHVSFRDYFTLGTVRLKKEGTLNGMDAAWIHIDDEAEYGRSYSLFLHSAQYHCVVIVSSNISFETAEALASAISLVDTEIPVSEADLNVVYGMRIGYLPADMRLSDVGKLSMNLRGDKVKPSDTDLDNLHSSFIATTAEDVSVLVILQQCAEPAAPDGWKVVQTGSIEGYRAWYLKAETGNQMLLLWDEQNNCQITPEKLEGYKPCDMAELEKIAAGIELVKLVVDQKAPLGFNGLAAG